MSRLKYLLLLLTFIPFLSYSADNKKEERPYGINLACAEFAEKNMPGIYGKHYRYPAPEELDYFKKKGLTLVRLPFKWERLQPQLYGNLDTVELTRLKDFVSAAEEREMKIILDLHNYARRNINGKMVIIGTNGLNATHLADFWGKMADEMKHYSNIYGYGLMNEPHDLSDSLTWFEMAQTAIVAIRETDMSHAIIVGGNDWSSAERWCQMSDTLKYLSDPADNLIFEAHVYFDRDASGSYRGSYDEEGASPYKGIERVKPFVEWLKKYDFKGLIGEYGVPDNDDRWLVTMDNFLSYLWKEGVNATYWAGGPWWGNYKLRITPDKGKDRPQMKIVEKYLYTWNPDRKTVEK